MKPGLGITEGHR